MLLLLPRPQPAPRGAENVHAVEQGVLLLVEFPAPQAEHVVRLIHEGAAVQRPQMLRRMEVKDELSARLNEQMQPPEKLRQVLRRPLRRYPYLRQDSRL